MLNYPPTNRPHCCIKCMLQPQSYHNTTATSSKTGTTKQKCTCQQLDITSSSSSSNTSEHFPVKLNPKINSIENKMPLPKVRQPSQQVKPNFGSLSSQKRERFQPQSMKTNNYSNYERFYSCSSEDSDTEAAIRTSGIKQFRGRRQRCKPGSNNVILELLHEVVHLINKDNPIRDEALRITQVAPSSLDDKSSKMTTQGSEVKVVECKHKDLAPPTTTPFAPCTWPPPCLCCAYGMAFGQSQPFNLSVIQPYNLMSSAAATPQIPEPFLYEETEESFKDCSSGNKSIIAEQIPDHLRCICSKISNICPKHGPLKKMLKKPDLPVTCLENIDIVEVDHIPKAEIEQPVCSRPIYKEEIKAKSDSSHEDIDEELHAPYAKIKAYDPQQDYTLNIKREFVDDDEEPRWEGKPDILSTPMETVEYVDEELHPHYVDKKCVNPTDNNEPSPDCLLVYDDEDPKLAEDAVDVDEEIQPIFVEQNPYEVYEPCLDCLMEYDDEDPSWPDISNDFLENPEATDVKDLPPHVASSKIVLPENDERPKPQENETFDHKTSAEFENSSQLITVATNETLQVSEIERSPYIVETSPTTGRNIYNFLPDIDRAEPKQQIIRYNESEEEFDSYYREEESELLGDEEYELAKEQRAESRKRKKHEVGAVPSTALATIKQLEGEGSPEEMKFFINSLLMDFEAMEHARRKSQFEKNICKSQSGLCARDSFPVTITDVTDLGANSLYVKWTVHDCCGIGGYEIYTDGYLTNRYYNSRHEAAVITQVDVTLPHKVALVAQPSADDESIQLMCNITNVKSKPKCLPWKTDVDKERKSCAALWTPSIFLYDPNTCRATAAPPIMRDNF